MLKQFVYVLKNSESPPKYYTGLTSDPQRRLAEHNQGSSIHTTKHGPWSVDVIIKFSDERRAIAFERYLKIAAILLASSLAATWIPAARATRVEPAITLRGD